jgi:hypothetical protein
VRRRNSQYCESGMHRVLRSQRRRKRLDFSRMSPLVTNQSIRTIAVTGLALLAVWYALFGGGGIATGPIDLAEHPAGWLVALAGLVVVIALLVVIRGVRRSRGRATPPVPLTPDDRMWSAHLAWLADCAVRRARATTVLPTTPVLIIKANRPEHPRAVGKRLVFRPKRSGS